MIQRWEEEGTIELTARGGRPRKISLQTDNYFVRTVVADRFVTVAVLKQNEVALHSVSNHRMILSFGASKSWGILIAFGTFLRPINT